MKRQDETHDEYLERLYPEKYIHLEIEKIEKLGYEIYPSDRHCQIFDKLTFLIDADFRDTYLWNLRDALYCFYYELK